MSFRVNKYSGNAGLMFVACFLASVSAHSAEIILNQPVTDSEGSVAVSVEIVPHSQDEVGAVQFDLHYDDAQYGLAEVVSGISSIDAGKMPVFSEPESGVVRVIVAGVNVNTLASGTVATVYFDALGNTADTSWFAQTATLNQVIASDPYGRNLTAEVSYAQETSEDPIDSSLDDQQIEPKGLAKETGDTAAADLENPLMSLARTILTPDAEGGAAPGLTSKPASGSSSGTGDLESLGRVPKVDGTGIYGAGARLLDDGVAHDMGQPEIGARSPETETQNSVSPSILLADAPHAQPPDSGNIQPDTLQLLQVRQRPLYRSTFSAVLASFTELDETGARPIFVRIVLVFCVIFFLVLFTVGFWKFKRSR